jgi:hypothetical protein
MLIRWKDRCTPALVFFAFFLVLLWRAPGLEFYLRSPDHGYQLALGRQVSFGKFPFVDLFSHYGPLHALTSAFGLWVSDSLISETIICALGYAAAILVIHRLTSRYVSRVAGVVTPLLGLVLLSRFYKWYYWLFPLLVLYCLLGYMDYPELRERDRWLYVAGILGGLAGLYRFDLGIASLCFWVICLLGLCLRPRDMKLFGRQLARFLAAFSLPFLLWCVVLVLHGGTLRDYLSATFQGGRGVVEEWTLPLPSFDWNNPLSQDSRDAFAFLLLPLTDAVCFLYGLWMEARHPGRFDLRYKVMTAVGLLGLGILPQALFRADVLHLLQVLPPALIAGSLLVSELWQATMLPEGNRRGRLFLRGIGISYLAVVAFSVWGIRFYGGYDLSRWDANPFPRYSQLSQGIHSGIDHPVAHLLSEVQDQTSEDDRILVVPLACHHYFFADRPVSGFLVGFAPGVLDDDKWRLRNLRMIQEHPPSVVIVKDSFFRMRPTNRFRVYQPELYAFLSTNYSQVVYQQDGWMLLTKPQED